MTDDLEQLWVMVRGRGSDRDVSRVTVELGSLALARRERATEIGDRHLLAGSCAARDRASRI